jgi:hypothetical protein
MLPWERQQNAIVPVIKTNVVAAALRRLGLVAEFQQLSGKGHTFAVEGHPRSVSVPKAY